MSRLNQCIISRICFCNPFKYHHTINYRKDPVKRKFLNGNFVDVHFQPYQFFQNSLFRSNPTIIKKKIVIFDYFPSNTLNFLRQKCLFLSNFIISFDIYAFMILLFSLMLRFYSLGIPRNVIFDEVHFGKAVFNYLENKHFFDLHPPLGKLLFYFVAWIFESKHASFYFEFIDQEIPNDVPLYSMRSLSALFGSFSPLLTYFILLTLNLSKHTAFLVGILVTFDNALIVQSRVIMLDSLLCFFSLLSTLLTLSFFTYKYQPFSSRWTILLILSSISIGICLGLKQSAYLTVIYLFLMIILELFESLLNIYTSFQLFLHLFLRFVFFVTVPIFLQFTFYTIHMAILYLPGNDDYLFSTRYIQSNFRSKCVNSGIFTYGSLIQIQNISDDCQYNSNSIFQTSIIWSAIKQCHIQHFCDSPFKSSNLWIIKKYHEDSECKTIKHHDVIELLHMKTGRKLKIPEIHDKLNTSHAISKYNYDHFANIQSKFFVVFNNSNKNFGTIIDTKFGCTVGFLVNDCHKFSSELKSLSYSHVNIEKPKLFIYYSIISEVFGFDQSKFLLLAHLNGYISYLVKFQENINNFLELNLLMVSKNSMLSDHPFSTLPHLWPFLTDILPYWKDSISNAQIQLVGNMFTWYFGMLSLVLYALFASIYFIFKGLITNKPFDCFDRYIFGGFILLLGWAIHFVPYFLLSRVLFLHHYLPALLFKILLLGLMAEFLENIVKISTRYRYNLGQSFNILFFFLIFGSLFYFFNLSIITYGLKSVELTDMYYFYSNWIIFT